jgi:hypothetical protein
MRHREAKVPVQHFCCFSYWQVSLDQFHSIPWYHWIFFCGAILKVLRVLSYLMVWSSYKGAENGRKLIRNIRVGARSTCVAQPPRAAGSKGQQNGYLTFKKIYFLFSSNLTLPCGMKGNLVNYCTFRRFSQNCEKCLLASSCLSVRQYACNNSTPTQRIPIKLGILNFF